MAFLRYTVAELVRSCPLPQDYEVFPKKVLGEGCSGLVVMAKGRTDGRSLGGKGVQPSHSEGIGAVVSYYYYSNPGLIKSYCHICIYIYIYIYLLFIFIENTCILIIIHPIIEGAFFQEHPMLDNIFIIYFNCSTSLLCTNKCTAISICVRLNKSTTI